MESLIVRTTVGWLGLSASVSGGRARVSQITLGHRSRAAVARALDGSSARSRETSGRRRSPVGGPPTRVARLTEFLDGVGKQVQEFLEGKRRRVHVRVDLAGGTPFQRKVWRAARRIPYGQVRSYGWIAACVGGSHYARAVGLALGANPVPLIVPCHRVIAHDGSLGGFSAGLNLKRRLLAIEGAPLSVPSDRGRRRTA